MRFPSVRTGRHRGKGGSAAFFVVSGLAVHSLRLTGALSFWQIALDHRISSPGSATRSRSFLSRAAEMNSPRAFGYSE